MAFGFSRCLHLSVCMYVCVRQSQVYPRHNLSPVQTRIINIRPEVHNTLVKIPIFGGSLTLAFNVKLNLKIKIYPICLSMWKVNAVRLSKFGPKMHLSTV